jgi:hypothetical protein
VGLVFLAVYPVGIPLFLFWLLWNCRHELDVPTVKMQFGFIYEGLMSFFALFCFALLWCDVFCFEWSTCERELGLMFETE